MRVCFDDNSFAFEFIRNLGFAYYGGADIGAMVATAARVKEGDFESWFSEFDGLARRLRERADGDLAAGHVRSATEAYLHASTYFRMAEFYLHGDPADARIVRTSQSSQQAYAKAAGLIGPTWEPVEIPYEGTTLPGYFYKVDDSGKPRPTLIFHGGYDSSNEELYYFAAAGAVRRGFNCLTWDGPGQGRPVREQGLHFRPDWEAVVTPAVDYALSRPDVDADNLVLMGMSLGGYLAARAAAFEHRFKAAVFFDGVYDWYESLRAMLPKDAVAAWDAGDRQRCEEIVHRQAAVDTNLRWLVGQGTWSYGVSSLSEFLDLSRQYTMQGIADRIRCPCLVLDAEDDMFFEGQPQRIFDELRVPKRLFTFGKEEGAENHCQSGALSYLHNVVFNWIDETLGRTEHAG